MVTSVVLMWGTSFCTSLHKNSASFRALVKSKPLHGTKRCMPVFPDVLNTTFNLYLSNTFLAARVVWITLLKSLSDGSRSTLIKSGSFGDVVLELQGLRSIHPRLMRYNSVA